MSRQDSDIREYFTRMDRSFYMDKDKRLARFDQAVSIGHGQTISQPSLVLAMTLALDVQPESRVLEIGTGSGFQTDLLASSSDSVYTVERIEPLHHRAKEKLTEAGFTNIYFKLGDGSLGWKAHSPYDRIMVTAAAPKVNETLLEQLKPGGKMVIPVGDSLDQELRLIEKDQLGEVTSSFLERVMFVQLIEDTV
ncbi:protein-L-isoaspartate(D-aspartate) O-methyltransferase [Salibacterium aidingense]|uniref:protein-L-isoaspartate(D-aspartate) O-methyltransferase n=1 Tax=Salibacterium aidingense TaxID=384933 RepID=UPI0004253CA6|nr:protein-L-isoaspartate(D-aspartate) O-methyltransferase [Salibacterium aidingense]